MKNRFFNKKTFFSLLVLVCGVSAWSGASATIIQADFRSELDLPFCCPSGGDRVLERLAQTLPNAGFELDESDEIANPSGWGDSLQVDLDPMTGIVSLVATGFNVYETVDIVISNMLFSASEKVIGFNVIAAGLATTFDSLTTSFTDNSVTISFVGDLSVNDTMEFLDGTDTFEIILGPDVVQASAPSTIALVCLGLATIGFRRRKAAKQ